MDQLELVFWLLVRAIITRILATVKQLLFTPQLVGEACQLGCPKIVLDHVRVIDICDLSREKGPYATPNQK